jgi:hypothetical protein
MRSKLFILSLFVSFISLAQTSPLDTLYLMNGRIITSSVLDTNSVSVLITDPENPTKKISIDNESLFAVKYGKGNRFYYYQQDTIKNWYTQDEMWLFMQGERDARKGFKAKGSFLGGLAAGLAGGASGLAIGEAGAFFGPVLPLAFFTTVGIPKVRIKHNTVSNPEYLTHDVYILGYEREARAKRRRQSLLGGGIGVAIGYIAYFSLRSLVLK